MPDRQTFQGPVDQQGRGADSGDLTLMQVTGSVLAAGFGVQSKENKLRDFSRGKPLAKRLGYRALYPMVSPLIAKAPMVARMNTL